MKLKDIRFAMIFGNNKGGDVRVVTPDGEIKFELGVKAEMIKGNALTGYINEGDTIELVGGVYVLARGGERVTSQRAQPELQSGANPDFRPTSYTEAEGRIRKLMKDLNDQSNSLEKRKKSFAATLDTVTEKKTEAKIKEAEENPVIEPESKPLKDGGENPTKA